MDELREAYVKDPRIACQYGRKCYQKNPTHHNKYKHPPDPKRKKIFNTKNETKRLKINDEAVESSEEACTSITKDETKLEKTNFSNAVSDSESEADSSVKIDDKSVDSKSLDSDEMNEFSKEWEHTEDDSKINSNISPSPTGNSNDNNEDETSCNNGRTAVCNHKNGHNNEFAKVFLKRKFLFEMPDDFYKFFEFCERLNKTKPCRALASVGLELVGPFDVLDGKFCGVKRNDEDYLLHWRYFYDPPQMQTVLKGNDLSGYHIGYFRDSPTENPVFMVENYAMKDGILVAVGENIFAAVSSYIEDKKRTADPFSKLQFNKFSNMVKEEAEKLGLNLSKKTKNITTRNNKVLSRTFNQIGLVVPYERKTQLGYRKLAMSDKALEELLTKIQKAATAEEKQKLLGTLQAEILTWTDIASDECDFGTGIELGWDILCHGVDLNHTVSRLLSSNFRQLKWEEFAKIAEAHMANRKKGCDLSII